MIQSKGGKGGGSKIFQPKAGGLQRKWGVGCFKFLVFLYFRMLLIRFAILWGLAVKLLLMPSLLAQTPQYEPLYAVGYRVNVREQADLRYEAALKQLHDLLAQHGEFLSLPITCDHDLDKRAYPTNFYKELYLTCARQRRTDALAFLKDAVAAWPQNERKVIAESLWAALR